MRPALRRTVKLGDVGYDVEGHARAMHRYLKTGHLLAFEQQREQVRRTFGTGKRTLAKQAARKAGLPEYGVVGPALYAAMWDADAYDAEAKADLARYAAQVDKLAPRERVVAAAHGYLAHAREIAYSQTRPIQTLARNIRLPDIPNAMDCSGLAISCYWMADMVAVLGQENSHGYGNTWSLADHGRSVSVVSLRPGDLVFYGACSHVAVVDKDPRYVITNGHYPMSRERVAYRGDYWGARTYLP